MDRKFRAVAPDERTPHVEESDTESELQLTEEQQEQFKKVFDRFDKDNGGTIDAEELEAAMHELGQNPTKVELQEMIEAVDADKSGTIDFAEFLNMMRTKIQDRDTAEDLVDALRLFDPRQQGSVSVSVLKHALLNLGEKMTEEEVDFVFERLPLNEDGKFDNQVIASTLLSSSW
ncbi:Calmodulin-related protein [Hondaea fermentalgiana]|uniref:Calmodulin n=1 Tax=Hondaea fermentalgiana TaxID=2315210 RepID=A0A2R5GHV2_9STRA|nr:Calmodulin-related protein [Hondaea fermentalgiana]|eukprot:GBG28233.1 Calmodulin-related protein [Hondaea fermentalgiana]